MRRLAAAAVIVAIAASPLQALDKEKAEYVGGTLAVAPRAEGTLATTDPDKMVFIAEKNGGMAEIPWKKISEIEYGQKVGRRVKEAILLSPIALLSKKRKHFLTLTFKDKDGAEQTAVFELGKDIVRTTLAVVQTRSGRKVTFQDEEAAKAFGN